MSDLGDRLNRLHVKGTSPDRSVRVGLTRKGVTVEFGPRGLAGHTERTLTEQIRVALTAAVHGFEKARTVLGAQLRDGPPHDLRGTHAETARLRFDAAVRAIRVTATSPRGCVTVDRRGQRDVDVRVGPGAIRRFEDAVLAAELKEAIAAAMTAHAEAVGAAYRATHPPRLLSTERT